MPEISSRKRVFLDSLIQLGFTEPECLLDSVEWVQLKRGEILFRQGEPGDSLYLVIRGRVRILVKDPDKGTDLEIASYTRGDILGELALLADQPRAATVQALRSTELARLRRDQAEQLFSDPNFMLPFAKLIAARAGRNEGKRQRPEVIGLFGATSDSAWFKQVSEGVISLMGEIAQVSSVRFAQAPAYLKTASGYDWDGLRQWLNEVEQDCRFLVLCSNDSERWNSELCHHVDKIVWFGRNVDDIADFTSWRHVLNVDKISASLEEHLVLDHCGAQVDAKAANRWYEAAAFVSVLHLPGQSDEHLARIARRLTGTANALVLSGGGARAMAHIGVIRALEEAGVPIDIIAGTSVGSVIAAQYAMGCDADTMLQMNRKFWHRLSRQFTLPIVSLWSDQLLEQMLKTFFGDRRLENLPMECFISVTNLDQSVVQYKRHGLVRNWCRASMSLPAIWPPYCDKDGVLYIDGGVLDNLPVASISPAQAGRIIASNVSRVMSARVSGPKAIPSDGVSALMMKFRGIHEAPSMGGAIFRAAVVGSLSQHNKSLKQADLVIEPEMEKISVNDYKLVGKIESAGYRTAQRVLKYSGENQNGTD